RKACRQHPPCEFVERAAQRRNLLRGAREPVKDCLDSVVFRTLVRRPLHNITGQQISRIDADGPSPRIRALANHETLTRRKSATSLVVSSRSLSSGLTSSIFRFISPSGQN